MKTVFVAMSGGIDSSFAAYLLKQRGYKVVGVTFALLPKTLKSVKNPQACCSLESTHRAKKVADGLSIPHYVINLREDFERFVIERFITEYGAGRTPNPCVLCNRYIKFSSFLQKALAIGADQVATGHYAGVEQTAAGWQLKKGRDTVKDQSYFLYPIRREQLPLILFPLADYSKSDVRRSATQTGWDFTHTRESQDICFVPDNDYRSFVGQFLRGKAGPVCTVDGKQIGSHKGLHLHTVGQRRGLNIPYSEPLYVVEIRTEENALIVGPKEALKGRRLRAGDVNLLVGAQEGRASGKVRYRQKEEPCTYAVRGGFVEVTFDSPVSSVTPGQSVVLYEGDVVLGGGTIEEAM